MNDYLNKLIEQFKTATGIKNIDTNSEQFVKEFSEWIRSRQVIGKGYVSMLDYMDVHPSLGSDTAEIGKGLYDSITKDSDLIVITPYSDGLEKLTSGLVIPSDFRVYDSIPTLVGNNGKTNDLAFVSSDDIRRFITQNPYNQSCISNWEELHNSGGSNITVGIYGSTHDKDVEQKIKQLKMLKDKLKDDSFKEEYATENDSYYYAIGSTRKMKTLVKTLTR